MFFYACAILLFQVKAFYYTLYLWLEIPLKGGCILPYGRHFHTGYGIFIVIQWSTTLCFIESQWICRIPYENASRTGVRILPKKIIIAGDAVPYCTLLFEKHNLKLVLAVRKTKTKMDWASQIILSMIVALLLPWSTYTATLLKYLRGYSKIKVELLLDQHCYFCVGTSAVTVQ